MVRASRLVGLPVVNLERATKIGITREVWLTLDLRRVMGLVVDLRRLFLSARFLRFCELFSLSTASVAIRDEAALETTRDLDIDGIGLQSVISSIMRTHDGNVIGSLSDLFIDENTGRVQELEVSEGVIQDITKGRTRISRPECTSFNGRTITLEDGATERPGTRG